MSTFLWNLSQQCPVTYHNNRTCIITPTLHTAYAYIYTCTNMYMHVHVHICVHVYVYMYIPDYKTHLFVLFILHICCICTLGVSIVYFKFIFNVYFHIMYTCTCTSWYLMSVWSTRSDTLSVCLLMLWLPLVYRASYKSVILTSQWERERERVECVCSKNGVVVFIYL